LFKIEAQFISFADSKRKIMVSHTLVKDVLIELEDKTEYYTIKSTILNLWISDLERDT